jgi:hypothetical protein
MGARGDLDKVKVFGSRDNGKKSQTLVWSKAESVATIAPGNLSSAKGVVWFEGRRFVRVVSCTFPSENIGSRCALEISLPIAARDPISHVTIKQGPASASNCHIRRIELTVGASCLIWGKF